MTWIFIGWMLSRLFVLDFAPVATDPATDGWSMEGGSGQPPSALEGGSGQPPSKLEGGSGQPPNRL